ncbi:hypothetical protein IGI04_042932, partial [Brassica rapa subsp. trilocularis]
MEMHRIITSLAPSSFGSKLEGDFYKDHQPDQVSGVSRQEAVQSSLGKYHCLSLTKDVPGQFLASLRWLRSLLRGGDPNQFYEEGKPFSKMAVKSVERGRLRTGSMKRASGTDRRSVPSTVRPHLSTTHPGNSKEEKCKQMVIGECSYSAYMGETVGDSADMRGMDTKRADECVTKKEWDETGPSNQAGEAGGTTPLDHERGNGSESGEQEHNQEDSGQHDQEETHEVESGAQSGGNEQGEPTGNEQGEPTGLREEAQEN